MADPKELGLTVFTLFTLASCSRPADREISPVAPLKDHPQKPPTLQSPSLNWIGARNGMFHTNQPTFPFEIEIDPREFSVIREPEVLREAVEGQNVPLSRIGQTTKWKGQVSYDGEKPVNGLLARTAGIKKNPDNPDISPPSVEQVAYVIFDFDSPSAVITRTRQAEGKEWIIVRSDDPLSSEIKLSSESDRKIATYSLKSGKEYAIGLAPDRTGENSWTLTFRDAAQNSTEPVVLHTDYTPFAVFAKENIDIEMDREKNLATISGTLKNPEKNLQPLSLEADLSQEFSGFPFWWRQKPDCSPTEIIKDDFKIVCKVNKKGAIRGFIYVTDVNGFSFRREFHLSAENTAPLSSADAFKNWALLLLHSAIPVFLGTEFIKWRKRSKKHAERAQSLADFVEENSTGAAKQLPDFYQEQRKKLGRTEKRLLHASIDLARAKTSMEEIHINKEGPEEFQKSDAELLAASLEHLTSAYKIRRIPLSLTNLRTRICQRWLEIFSGILSEENPNSHEIRNLAGSIRKNSPAYRFLFNNMTPEQLETFNKTG